MKKILLILFCLFIVSIAYADTDVIEGTATSTTDTYEGIADTVTDKFEGQTVAAGGAPTPSYHNAMNNVTDPHNPTIGDSTQVHGSPSTSGDGVDFLTGQSFECLQDMDGGSGTVLIQLRPHETGWPAANRVYWAARATTNLYIRLETSALRFRYGATSLTYLTNTDFVDGQLVTLRGTWNINGANIEMELFVNESSVGTKDEADSEITPVDIYIGNSNDTGGSGTFANAVIEDVKIWGVVVTP